MCITITSINNIINIIINIIIIIINIIINIIIDIIINNVINNVIRRVIHLEVVHLLGPSLDRHLQVIDGRLKGILRLVVPVLQLFELRLPASRLIELEL